MINNIISLLREILKEIEKNNPYGLIGKGGTILSIYHLGHRDSQDLDFDCLIDNKDNDFESYFKSIFNKVCEEYKITYMINKTSFSSTGRFHLKVIFSTHKALPPTKMEINFIDSLPSDLLNQGQFQFYSLEHLLFQKLRASSNRAEIKDIIDVGVALNSKDPTIDSTKLKQYIDIKKLITEAITRIEELEKNPKEWKEEFAHSELKFNIDEKKFPGFMKSTKIDLHKLSRLL